ncbi:MAG: c-type cytochrome [Gammaproteobacteria bacterium]|nr:c-type cytochrome [Gammaproteobacteria bacterium]MDH4253187.1 c-type cytochrome [Gammaproteobacteria bacterium]MDH5308451.1 c-type cytochrome [Gammaproteobacteria bacterium]
MTTIFRRLLPALCALVALPPSVAAQQTPDAARIYAESCSVCHGDDGSGAIWGQASLATPPRNFRSEESRRELDRNRMIASVTYGRPGTPMPGFGTQLMPAEVAAVVDYVREQFMQGLDAPAAPLANVRDVPYSHTPPPAPHELPLPDGLSGHVERGRAYYMENCVPCHGASGTGDGPRAYFIFPKPRNFLEPTTRSYLNRPNVYKGIKFGVVGKEMPAWGKVMDDQQIADIAEFVYTSFIESGTAADH